MSELLAYKIVEQEALLYFAASLRSGCSCVTDEMVGDDFEALNFFSVMDHTSTIWKSECSGTLLSFSSSLDGGYVSFVGGKALRRQEDES